MYLFNIRYHKTIKHRFNAKWLSGGCGGYGSCGGYGGYGGYGVFGVVENYKDYERLKEVTKIM